jgi:predicted nuclease of predicted toxin-antitoxin system
VRQAGLASADDQAVWEYAGRHGLAIVSKDSDFQHRALLYGPPPKVIWVRLGNCSTAQIAILLRARQPDLLAFEVDPTASCLVLS